LRYEQQNPAREHYGMYVNSQAGQRRPKGSGEVIAGRESHEYSDQHEPGNAGEKGVIKPLSRKTSRHRNCNWLLR
jgi:hypothetical protein